MTPIDPRYAVVERRLAGIGRIVAVTGGKGGIGKSVISSALALTSAAAGYRTGLLDLDLTAPTDHVILGLGDQFPTEQFGVEPPEIAGVRFMSVSYFAAGRPTPLRGADVTNALLEILAITRWEELDVLVIDMPPGLGDATLDIVRWVRRAEYLAIATRSRIVLETVRRMVRFLRELGASIPGVVENMAGTDTSAVRDLAGSFDLPVLASIPLDAALEEAIGDPAALLRTRFAAEVARLGDALLADSG